MSTKLHSIDVNSDLSVYVVHYVRATSEVKGHRVCLVSNFLNETAAKEKVSSSYLSWLAS